MSSKSMPKVAEPLLYIDEDTGLPRESMFVSGSFEKDETGWILIFEDENGEDLPDGTVEVMVVPLTSLKRLPPGPRRQWERASLEDRQDLYATWEEILRSFGPEYAKKVNRRLPDGKGRWIDL